MINPQANEWLSRDESGKLFETDSADRSSARPRTGRHVQSAHVQGLARSLGLDPEEVASRLSPDMIRRLKFPAHAHMNEDGTTRYYEDKVVVDGMQVARGTDFSEETGSAMRDPRRDASGRFTPRPK